MTNSTRGIGQNFDPHDWPKHHFGLPERRWVSLAGRSFWITGAGTGYGRALATALAAAEATVFLSGRRQEKLAAAIDAAKQLKIEGNRMIAVPCDISDPSSVAFAATSIFRHSGSPFAVVNNAASPQRPVGRQPLLTTQPEAWSSLLATNVNGAWLVTRAALPHMAHAGSIRALFITSEAGWAFTPGMGPYNVTKAALNSLGACFAEECATAYSNLDVQINILVPGEAGTEMNQGSDVSPYAIVHMALALLSHPRGGPNGRFFHRDGRHLAFAYAEPYDRDLLETLADPVDLRC
jgi:NAD(P)-dependent dehydrogenase (short-subunit alcohol dehydrogenase family)